MKMRNAVQKYGPKVKSYALGVAGFTLLPLGTALAAEPDYSAITAQAVWTTVAAGVVAIFAAVALVKVALAGGRKLLSAIR